MSIKKRKTCSRCGAKRFLHKFHRRTKSKDGHQSWCKECSCIERVASYKRNPQKQREYARKRTTDIRKRLWTFLQSNPCVDCGEDNPIVLEFDHVRGTKVDAVALLVKDGYGWETIMSEIEKCDVRCANCHRIKTAKDQNWYGWLVK